MQAATAPQETDAAFASRIPPGPGLRDRLQEGVYADRRDSVN
ncbi:hypothetical protein [Streptomonospora litoralis]|nr:hypothetical protein [Streptomonospora litoralis]